MTGPDLYSLLGLANDASPDEIRDAYFRAARRLHPDANQVPTSSDLFIEVQQAYEILSNPRKRAEYDAQIDSHTISDPAISVNLRPVRSTIPRLDEPQLFYLLVELFCTQEVSRTRLPRVNLCLVVDRSTSMQGQRMDMVKTNIQQIIKTLRSDDLLSVVAFSDRAEVVIPPTPVGASPRLDNHISMLQTGGGTEIYQGLKAGVDLLRQNGAAPSVRQLFLLTDGNTFGDENACLTLAEQASLEGISISALGIGHEWNDSFLDKLVSFSGESATFIQSPHDLPAFFERKIKAITSTYASSIQLALKPNPSIELRYAFRLHPEASSLPVTGPLALGSLQYGGSIHLLMELLIHPLSAETTSLMLVNGRLNMDVHGQAARRARLFVELKQPVFQEIDPEPLPPAILQALSRVSLYRLQDQARQEAARGDVAGATRRLQFLATRLLSCGERDLAHMVLMESENIRQSQGLSEEGEKRIKYGTRSLLLPPGPEFQK